MPSDHREIAFERAIEDHLLKQGGYIKGDPARFDTGMGLDASQVIGFIKDTQTDLWQELSRYHKGSLERAVVDELIKTLDYRGTLDVIRHGIKFYGKLIRLAYFAPAHGLNPEIMALYNKNRLIITRQVPCGSDGKGSIDMVISLNGLPIATMELKNPMTGQTVTDAQSQYKARDVRETIFRFKRGALVHFAVDTDEVYMTTRLAGGGTYFLPFNKGDGTGAGNPVNPHGYKTAYMWEQILERHTLLDIVARFLHLETEEKDVGGRKARKEKMIFPRYHQWDVVCRLEADARRVGVGKNYLVQHSAGSGKSNSIAWLAHRLVSLHTEQDNKVFDNIIIVTDRLVLDRQLQDTVYQFEHKQGVVQRIDQDSRQLAQALKSGVPIIITTLQKFPFVTEHIGTLPERRYAIIVDEAHSSQSGEGAKTMREVLVAKTLEEAVSKEIGAQDDELEDYEEEIIRTMKARGRQANISYFAFTATPKHKTLEIFGQPGPDGDPKPFHLYSMRQAIEEGFILDVLQHYTTYKTYYKLLKMVDDDPEVEKKKAARALARFLSLHPHNIAQKTEVILEHFREFTAKKISGRAKAMVVTGSRLHAVRYKQAFDKYIKDHGYSGIKTLVAFSGKVIDEDVDQTYTEVGMNEGIRESELPERFDSDEYQVLLVAEKYQTGFDQPLLHTMYVDKRLGGVRAVQTLSRLNRIYPGKEDTFVLDFVNSEEDIRRAFQPYYEQSSVAETADPQQLYALQHKLNGYQIYFLSEVEGFCKVFFGRKQTRQDHAMLNSFLDPAVQRYMQRDEEEQEEFKGALSSYRNLYAFLSQVIPYNDSDLEKLYAYARFLLSKLPRREGGPKYSFDDEVALEYYRIQKVAEGQIHLTPGAEDTVSGPTSAGQGVREDDEVPLSSIIDTINERFGTEFTEADIVFLDQIALDASGDAELRQGAKVNSRDNFRHLANSKIEGLFIDRMDRNKSFFVRYMNDDAFYEFVNGMISDLIYSRLKEEAG
jgi:type I restriction enzyme R subunit